MKLLGLCNLFVREVSKNGKSWKFADLSISSKQDDKYINYTLPCYFSKDCGDVNELDANVCYNVEIKDSIVNVEYDEFKKANILKVCILDIDFKKETKFKAKEESPKKGFGKKK